MSKHYCIKGGWPAKIMHKNGVYFKRKNEKLVKLRTVFGVAALLLGHSQVSAMSFYIR